MLSLSKYEGRSAMSLFIGSLVLLDNPTRLDERSSPGRYRKPEAGAPVNRG